MNWNNTDPRSDLIGRKHASIIILRPNPNGPGWLTGTAHVDHSSIEKWDSDWKWTLDPKENT